MNLKNIFSLKLLSAAIIVSLGIVSCNNDDTNDTPVATADTNFAPLPDTSHTMMADTNKMPANKGIGKPDPAKKGMKGKVRFTPPPPANPEAKMEADASGIYSNVEVIPSFPGGYKGMQKYFDENLKYPEEAGSDGVDGTVNVTFIVDENGKLTSPQVAGEHLGYGLEEEALRVVNSMPTWNPGKLKGKNVKTRFTLPVRFILE